MTTVTELRARREALLAQRSSGVARVPGSGRRPRASTCGWSTEAAGCGLRGGKISPGEWERRRGLRRRFVYRPRGPSLLVADRARIDTRGRAMASRSKTGRNQVTAPIFLLVPQVKLQKRLDLARDADRVQGQVPRLIVAHWLEGRF